ncbi:probable protein trichome birefringence-like 10 [Coccomyxa sp. Obi]|nr:probable protein trichome birefringence-like 10 [Coccomyxa sp. Obi]
MDIHRSTKKGRLDGLFCVAQDDFVRARESALWRWRPNSCSLFDFRPMSSERHTLGALLKKLGPRKIILVGDSLTLEQYLSLEGLLGSEIVDAQSESVHINGEPHAAQAASFITRSGLQVSYTRSDFLVNKDTMELDLPDPKTDPLDIPHYTMTNMSHLGCCSNPWTHLLDSPSSYLVLSTSAHWWSRRGTGPEQHAAAVQSVLRHLVSNFKGEKVFVRVSVAGHPQCQLAQGPYSDVLYQHEAYWHNWGEFKAHNDAWRHGIAALNDSRFVFVDVEPMTRVRPDGHLRPGAPDCLHYCLPGVIDYWTLLLASFWMSCRSGIAAV